MPAFLAACVVAVLIAIGAYAVLNHSSYAQDAASSVFSTTSTRL